MVLERLLSPVFIFECLTTSRRWQVFAARVLFVLALLVNLTAVWWGIARRVPDSAKVQAEVGQLFFVAIVATEFMLVLLAAPAATASAICLDKTRGTLAHVIMTDLTDTEIILGKLGAKLVPALATVACALPVLALATLLGGVDPGALLGCFLLALGLTILGCAVGLTLSVWASQTFEVLLVTYSLMTIWLLMEPVWLFGALARAWAFPPGWLGRANPFFLAFADLVVPGSVGIGDDVNFFIGTLLLASALTALAIARVRAVVVRHADRPARTRNRTRWWPGPSLDHNPVLWREWQRRQPSWWGRAAWWSYAVLTSLFSLVAIGEMLNTAHPARAQFVCLYNALQVAVGLALLCVMAPTSLAEERIRGTLEVLLTTPLSTREIVWGKWWGSYRPALPLAFWPTLVAAATGWRNGFLLGALVVLGLVLGYGAAITSLGLALATWVERLIRALVLAVGIYAVMTVGWVFLVVTLSPGNQFLGGLIFGSPFFGPLLAMITICGVGPVSPARLWAWGFGWMGFELVLAWLLYRTTRASFDRCLGRIRESEPHRAHRAG